MTAIITTPNAATGFGTSGTIGVSWGTCGDEEKATRGMATRATTLTADTAAPIVLARFTSVRLSATARTIESAATTCPAEIVHVQNGNGIWSRIRDIPRAGRK